MPFRLTQSQSQMPFPSNLCTATSCSTHPSILSYKVLSSSNISEPISDCRIFKDDALYLNLFITYAKTPPVTLTFPKGITIIKDKTLIELSDYEISINSTHTNLTLVNTTIYETGTINLTIYLYATSKVDTAQTEQRQVITHINDSFVDCSLIFNKSVSERESITLKVTKLSDEADIKFDFVLINNSSVPYYIRMIQKLYSNTPDKAWSHLFCKKLDTDSPWFTQGLPSCPGGGNDCSYYYQAELYYVADGTTADCSQIYFSSSNIVLFPNITNELPEPNPDPEPLPQEPVIPNSNSTKKEFTTEPIVILSIVLILGGGLIGVMIFCFIKVFRRARQRVNGLNSIKEEQRIEKEKGKKENSMNNDKKSLKAGEDGEDEVNSKRTV